MPLKERIFNRGKTKTIRRLDEYVDRLQGKNGPKEKLEDMLPEL